MQALEETINRADVDAIVAATPCDLAALIAINKPVLRTQYRFAETGEPGLGGLVESFLKES